jgi:hypothetical protein
MNPEGDVRRIDDYMQVCLVVERGFRQFHPGADRVGTVPERATATRLGTSLQVVPGLVAI